MFPLAYPQQGGALIDVTRLTPFDGGASNATITTSFQTLLSINGKGFIETFYADQSATASLSIRMTVDGVVKMLLSTTANTIGLVNKKDQKIVASASVYRGGSSTAAIAVGLGVLKPYPTTDSSNGAIILGMPIYFKNSLLLELSLASGTCNYGYSGGYM
jgi:hypothetical protein